MTDFIPITGGHYILQGEDFYVSYNPAPWSGISLFESDDKQEETALVIEGPNHKFFLILNGDFREEYKEAFPDLAACLDVYKRHENTARSTWSGDTPLEELMEYLIKRIRLE